MLGYILLIVGLLFVAAGMVYVALAGRKDGDKKRKGTPVTLDRNPHAPKMPGSTS